MFKPTPLLSDGTPADELSDILEAAKKAVETSEQSACRFNDDGTPSPDGMYETWPSADGSHQIVSYS